MAYSDKLVDHLEDAIKAAINDYKRKCECQNV